MPFTIQNILTLSVAKLRERGAFLVANYFHFGNSWFYSFNKCC